MVDKNKDKIKNSDTIDRTQEEETQRRGQYNANGPFHEN